jgi:hypothetical protein
VPVVVEDAHPDSLLQSSPSLRQVDIDMVMVLIQRGNQHLLSWVMSRSMVWRPLHWGEVDRTSCAETPSYLIQLAGCLGPSRKTRGSEDEDEEALVHLLGAQRQMAAQN